MGLLDYYRQFEEMSEEEYNRGLRERRAREKALALEQIEVCDLSRTEWPDFPDSEVVNASIYAARGGVNSYPERNADRVRKMLAERHGIEPERVALGNGAIELLQAAVLQLVGAGGELVTPWPSYPLYPLMARRAGALPVPVDLTGSGHADPSALLEAVGERTRAVVLCNPNDPTGTRIDSASIERFANVLPERVRLLVDEAFVHFQDSEPEDAILRLTDRLPNLLVFRTFSKIYGLSGMRAGYVVGAVETSQSLASLAPVLGVNSLTQAAVAHALKVGDPEVARRKRLVGEQRARVLRAFHDLPVDAPQTEANFAWISAAGLSGAELAARLERASVVVAPGGPLGDDAHVRAAIRGPAATDRLLAALREAFGH